MLDIIYLLAELITGQFQEERQFNPLTVQRCITRREIMQLKL